MEFLDTIKGIAGGAKDVVSSVGNIGGGDSGSFWSNPTIMSSAILAGTQLISGLFGSSGEEDFQNAQLAEQQRQFDLRMALEKAQLAQALEIAKINASGRGGDGGAGAMRDAQLRIAKASAAGNVAEQKAAALQIPLQARANQVSASQNSGVQSGAFFNALIDRLQRPSLRG